jgi:acetaldehyde dehydrogenase/alcohol dehydrogenase
MLPHVIAYNASVPTKFMPSPNQRAYVAHKKYAMMADLLGLGGHTVEEKVQKLIASTEQLLDHLGVPRSIAELGISKEEFEAALPELAKIAFDDPSWRSNPRMPLVEEIVELFRSAYKGRGAAIAQRVADKKEQKAEEKLVAV